MNAEFDVVVRGRHLEVSQAFRDYVTEKFSRVARFGVPLSRIDIEVSRESNPRLADVAFKTEITCVGTGPVIRAEAAAGDKHSALDLAFGRLEERLRRAGDKKRPRRGIGLAEEAAAGAPQVATAVAVAVEEDEEPDDTVFEEGPVVVRRKTHRAGQMSVEQALYQMELVGHDFYLFRDADSGSPSVVYRRRGYDYGLIRLDDEAAVG